MFSSDQGPSFGGVMRMTAIVLLLVQIYVGIGIGLLYAVNGAYNRRCGQDAQVTSAMVVASGVVWPAIFVAAGVWRLLDGEPTPCRVR